MFCLQLRIYECILSSFVKKGILVEPLDTERQMKENLAKMEKQPESDKLNYPKDYATLYDFFAGSSSVTALIGMWRGSHAILSFFFFFL